MSSSNQRHTVITTILEGLFLKEEAFLRKRELDMIGLNVELGGSRDGYRHLGQVYTELTGPGLRKAGFSRLHSSLIKPMEGLLSDRKATAFEKERIRQALALVLKDCRDWQDVRDALPNGLKVFLPECSHLERTRKEAFTLEDNPRAQGQYERLKEKIEYYVATQLLY